MDILEYKALIGRLRSNIPSLIGEYKKSTGHDIDHVLLYGHLDKVAAENDLTAAKNLMSNDPMGQDIARLFLVGKHEYDGLFNDPKILDPKDFNLNDLISSPKAKGLINKNLDTLEDLAEGAGNIIPTAKKIWDQSPMTTVTTGLLMKFAWDAVGAAKAKPGIGTMALALCLSCVAMYFFERAKDQVEINEQMAHHQPQRVRELGSNYTPPPYTSGVDSFVSATPIR